MVFIDNSIYHAVHLLVNRFMEIIVLGNAEQHIKEQVVIVMSTSVTLSLKDLRSLFDYLFF